MKTKRYVLLGLTQFALLSLLIIATWREGWKWWRFLVLILGVCLVWPIAVGFVQRKLNRVLSGKGKAFRYIVNSLMGTILMGGALTVFSYLAGYFDRVAQHLVVSLVTYLELGILYALALEIFKRKTQAPKP